MSEGARTVLIVDDDADFSEAVATYLRSRGYRVVQARDGRDGLKRARLEAPDVVLMDIMMEERTAGFFVVQELRRHPELARVPVFVVSSLYAEQPGFGIDPDPRWLGHDEFFRKPVDLERLVSRIEARLQGAAGGAAPGGGRSP